MKGECLEQTEEMLGLCAGYVLLLRMTVQADQNFFYLCHYRYISVGATVSFYNVSDFTYGTVLETESSTHM